MTFHDSKRLYPKARHLLDLDEEVCSRFELLHDVEPLCHLLTGLGSYVGKISSVLMQINDKVWLLLTHCKHTQVHGLRVGALVAGRPHHAFEKRMRESACFGSLCKVPCGGGPSFHFECRVIELTSPPKFTDKVYCMSLPLPLFSRLALSHGARALYIHFTNDAEETFQKAPSILQKKGMVEDGEEVALVQSGRQPIWRSEYTHHIQVRKVRA